MNRYLAEAFGTFCLVFAGCGAIMVTDLTGQPGHVGVSVVFGLVVMAMIYAVGNISGAHLNPAVTLGFVFARRMRLLRAGGYALSQFAGAFLAAGMLRLLLGDVADLGATRPGADFGVGQALLMEIVLTFILMFVVLNVSTGHMEKGIMAGVAVGGVIALEALFGGPVSGASMNPARSLAPAVVGGTFADQWIYLLGPIVGATLAHPTCRLIQGRQCCPPKTDTGELPTPPDA